MPTHHQNDQAAQAAIDETARPLASETPDAVAHAAAPESMPPEQMSPPTILLVDDDRSVREALARVIADDGFHVITAASAKAAVTRLATHNVDLIVTDLRMPKTNGWDLLFHYHFQRPTLPVFVITALPPTECQGAEKVATAFFTKPVDCPALLAALHEQLAPADSPGTKPPQPT